MRLLGFDYVFDTNYSADLTTMEEAHELLRRVKSGGPFPMVCRSLLSNFSWYSFEDEVRGELHDIVSCLLAPHISSCSIRWISACYVGGMFGEKRTLYRLTPTVHLVLPGVDQHGGETVPGVYAQPVDVQVAHGHAGLGRQERLGKENWRYAWLLHYIFCSSVGWDTSLHLLLPPSSLSSRLHQTLNVHIVFWHQFLGPIHVCSIVL